MNLDAEIERVQEAIRKTESEHARTDLQKYLLKLQKKKRAEQYRRR